MLLRALPDAYEAYDAYGFGLEGEPKPMPMMAFRSLGIFRIMAMNSSKSILPQGKKPPSETLAGAFQMFLLEKGKVGHQKVGVEGEVAGEVEGLLDPWKM